MSSKMPTAKRQLEMYESIWKGASPNPHIYLLAKSYRDAIKALCDCVLPEVDTFGHCEICQDYKCHHVDAKALLVRQGWLEQAVHPQDESASTGVKPAASPTKVGEQPAQAPGGAVNS